jgi:hypothetical protein
MHYWKDTSYRGHAEWNGENPPEGAIFTYSLAQPAQAVSVTVSDAEDNVIRTLEGDTDAGVNRLVWDLRYPAPQGGGFGGGGDQDEDRPDPLLLRNSGARGAFVTPGTYTVTITAGGASATQTVEVRGDPGMPVTVAQAEARTEFVLEITNAQARLRTVQQRLTQERNRLRESGPRQRREQVEAALTRVQRAGREIGGIANGFSGSGVRSGTMHPPTSTHRAALDEAIAAMDAAEALLGG